MKVKAHVQYYAIKDNMIKMTTEPRCNQMSSDNPSGAKGIKAQDDTELRGTQDFYPFPSFRASR